MNSGFRCQLEYLRWISIEGAGPKSRSHGQTHHLTSVRKGSKLSQRRDCRPRYVTERVYELAQRFPAACCAHVGFMREDIVVERSQVANVSPHFEQHDSKV